MEKRRGWLMAGLVSGFVYGVVASVIQILVTLAFKPDIISFLTQRITEQPSLFQNVTPSDLFSLSISLIPMIAITGGLLIGIVLSFVYSGVYGSVPGKTPFSKGPIFGLGLWVILNLGIGLVDIPQFGLYYYAAGAIGGFAAAIAYGYVLALLSAYLNRS